MLSPIFRVQEDHVIDLHDCEVYPGVTANDLYIVLTFYLEDAIATAREQMFGYRLLLRVWLR
ncbi:MAG: hypothetical protein ABI833_21150 [Acidobacteriota bacterium]